MIQSHIPVRIGNSGVPNLPGAWHLLIPVVERTSVWCVYEGSGVDILPSFPSHQSVNLELGIGDPGLEQRRWKSIAHQSGGSELEFDDSWWVGYLPYNFRAGDRISARIATWPSPVAVNINLQLQLYS